VEFIKMIAGLRTGPRDQPRRYRLPLDWARRRLARTREERTLLRWNSRIALAAYRGDHIAVARDPIIRGARFQSEPVSSTDLEYMANTIGIDLRIAWLSAAHKEFVGVGKNGEGRASTIALPLSVVSMLKRAVGRLDGSRLPLKHKQCEDVRIGPHLRIFCFGRFQAGEGGNPPLLAGAFVGTTLRNCNRFDDVAFHVFLQYLWLRLFLKYKPSLSNSMRMSSNLFIKFAEAC
jgi:hypothetical protein